MATNNNIIVYAMDLDTLRTFTEVSRIKNFAKTAQHLCIAPSTVGARIKLLESQLGVSLFRRGYHNLTLTPAGERLLQHAQPILSSWDRAHEEVALNKNTVSRLVVAGAESIWDLYLQGWVNRAIVRAETLSVRLESRSSALIAQSFERGLVDLAFLFAPPQIGGVKINEVCKVPLHFVTTYPNRSVDELLERNYINVEWSTAFSNLQAQYFPSRPPARARVNNGRMALEILLSGRGSAYLPLAWVSEYIDSERLRICDDAPPIELSIYSIHSTRSEHRDLIEELLAA